MSYFRNVHGRDADGGRERHSYERRIELYNAVLDVVKRFDMSIGESSLILRELWNDLESVGMQASMSDVADMIDHRKDPHPEG